MKSQSRRDFFASLLTAGSALVAAGVAAPAGAADGAATGGGIRGICLYVPALGTAAEFVEGMRRSAPGSWTAHALEGEMVDLYFDVRRVYQEAKGRANTFVGVVDPASFAVVHEAIADAGGSFHYVTYQDATRVTFSAQV